MSEARATGALAGGAPDTSAQGLSSPLLALLAGGDIAAVYHGGRAGDHGIGQRFFADEYRMNAAIRDYPKPVVAFMQGFVMGGGVGIGGHASHRVVGDTTQVAMPESGIGLIPDVGGTWLLARAPGRIHNTQDFGYKLFSRWRQTQPRLV